MDVSSGVPPSGPAAPAGSAGGQPYAGLSAPV